MQDVPVAREHGFVELILDFLKLYGTKPEHFAKIAEKNHRHSVENPNSQFRDEYTLQQVT